MHISTLVDILRGFLTKLAQGIKRMSLEQFFLLSQTKYKIIFWDSHDCKYCKMQITLSLFRKDNMCLTKSSGQILRYTSNAKKKSIENYLDIVFFL